MRLLRLTIVVLFVILQTGCVSDADSIIPDLVYAKPISVHLKKSAFIAWKTDGLYQNTKDYEELDEDEIPISSTVTAIEMEVNDHHVKTHWYAYGRGQEAQIIRSLKDTLLKNNVFDKVEFVPHPKTLGKADVEISIDFKNVRTSYLAYDRKIVLDVNIQIKDKQHVVFNRTYLIESKPEKLFSMKKNVFVDKQNFVSKELLSKIIYGIEQCHKKIR